MPHAFLAPSSADRIELCNGSAKMERLYPQDDTEETREGDAVHWAGWRMLVEFGPYSDYANDPYPAVGVIAPNGVVLNNEMLDGAIMWVDAITVREIGHVEDTITTPVLHPENWGTPDHWFFDWQTLTLYVDDFKFGHRYVPVFGNRQLINYAALILNKLGLWGRRDIRIVFTIVQPRSYHRGTAPRTWATTSAELEPYWQRLVAAFNAAAQPDVKVTPHPDACRDCKARWDCEGALAASYIGVDMAYQSEPLQMSPAALSREYRLLLQAETFITARRKGIEDRVMQVMRRQQAVPYFTLENHPGRRVWNDDAIANGIMDILAAHNVKVQPQGISVTPTQALKAGVPEHVVKLFSKRNSGTLRLVEDDGSAAAQAFNQPTE